MKTFFTRKFISFSLLLVLVLGSLAVSGCSKKAAKEVSIAVFVPGVMAGSPTYEMLAAGSVEAVEEYNKRTNQNVKIDVIEAGTNQAEWSSKLTAVTAGNKYSLIVSSNSSLPAIIEPLTEQFPEQKYLVLDAYLENNSNVATVNYNQREQGYLTGYAAGLATTADSSVFPYTNSAKKIALIAAQEYPVMNEIILPAFEEGAKAADSGVSVEFRIVGNWYDASKSADIARSLYEEGVDVILPISGGANQGVISAAQSLNFYVTWFDNNGYDKAPGLVISSMALEQKKLAKEMVSAYLEDKLEFGTAKTVGIKDGYITFVKDDPVYRQNIPAAFIDQLSAVEADIKAGKLKLPAANK